MDESTVSTPTQEPADPGSPRNSPPGMANPWRYRKVLVSPDRGSLSRRSIASLVILLLLWLGVLIIFSLVGGTIGPLA